MKRRLFPLMLAPITALTAFSGAGMAHADPLDDDYVYPPPNGNYMTINKIDSATGKPVTGAAMDDMTLLEATCYEDKNGHFTSGRGMMFASCDDFSKALSNAGDDVDALNALGVVRTYANMRRDGSIRLAAGSDASGWAEAQAKYAPDAAGIPTAHALMFYREGAAPTGYKRDTTWHSAPYNINFKGEVQNEDGYVARWDDPDKVDTIVGAKGETTPAPDVYANFSTKTDPLGHIQVDLIDQNGLPIPGAKFLVWSRIDHFPFNVPPESANGKTAFEATTDAGGQLIIDHTDFHGDPVRSGFETSWLGERWIERDGLDWAGIKLISAPKGYTLSDKVVSLGQWHDESDDWYKFKVDPDYEDYSSYWLNPIDGTGYFPPDRVGGQQALHMTGEKLPVEETSQTPTSDDPAPSPTSDEPAPSPTSDDPAPSETSDDPAPSETSDDPAPSNTSDDPAPSNTSNTSETSNTAPGTSETTSKTTGAPTAPSSSPATPSGSTSAPSSPHDVPRAPTGSKTRPTTPAGGHSINERHATNAPSSVGPTSDTGGDVEKSLWDKIVSLFS